jgi:hydroxymethylpyrimidine/phosphomethylpyrimidine kinase
MTVIASSSISGAAKKRYARVLSIAGSDSGGGAGIQADLKTCAALGCYGMTAITAITVQNTLGVTGIHGIPLDTVRGQIDAVVQDIGVGAVKIGMLATPDVVSVVADAIRRHRIRNVVLDPVMVATSGDRLIVPETAQALVSELFPLATVITPNLDEAALLLGRSIDGIGALDAAVADLLAMGAPAVLLKGGHLSGDLVMDVLGRQGQQAGDYLRLQSQRIITHNGHGTGCTLSSAIASFLAQGLALEAAVTEARRYNLGAIEAGAEVYTGQGHGPLNHGYAPRAQLIVEG